MKAWIVVMVLLAGCASVPPRKPTGLKASDFLGEQVHRRARLSSISSKLHLRYTARSENVAGRGRFMAQAPTRMRLELRDPLGRTQFLVGMDGEEFVALYPTQRKAYVDKQAGLAYMKKFLGYGCSFRDVQSLLLGVLPPSAKIDKISDWMWVDGVGAYRGHVSRGNDRFTVDVDPDTAAIRELTWENGHERATVVYGDFSACCAENGKKGLTFAHVASLKLEPSGSKLEAEWDDVEPGGPPKGRDAFVPTLPENVLRIPLP